MLNNISWVSFLLYTGGALLVYYVVLVVVKGSGWLVKNSSTGGLPPISAGFKRFWTPQISADQKEEIGEDKGGRLLQTTVHDLVDELQAFFSSAEKAISKDELLAKLKLIITKYPSIKKSRYEEGITNLVGITAANECSIQLTEDELTGLWV
jgi:hypothetical protein